MNFAVVNLGCKVNRVESDDVAALLASCAHETPEAQADLIVINTCTVTGEAEKKTRKAVRRALRANDHAHIVVTGCAAAIDAEYYQTLDRRIETVGKAALAVRVSELMGSINSQLSGPLLRMGKGFRTRVGVKVQDGCDNACTYCIVHVARGHATSRPADEVVRECVEHARAGAKEIVLTGINLGSYCDGDKRSPRAVRLPDLLRRLLDETADVPPVIPSERSIRQSGEPSNSRAHETGTERLREAGMKDPLQGQFNEPPVRFRISSIEPRDVDDALIDLLATSEGRVCRHLHLPLQAGSSKVLREMARPYDAKRFIALVDTLRNRVPQIALSTDIIAGFPGETDEEFAETLAVACHCRFSKIHVFPYSRREGTPAAARLDQVGAEVKANRAARLRAMGEILRVQDFAARSGTREFALVEEGGVAMTESYFEVPAPSYTTPGMLVEIVLKQALRDKG